jgi:hypothetical protein
MKAQLLFARFKKKSCEALCGFPPTFAMAIVPRTLEMPGSLRGDGRDATCVKRGA